MPRKQSDVERSLLAKGFRQGDGDHDFFHYYSFAGKKTRVFTKTSHGAREIDDHLLSRMAKQCKLSNKEFWLLIDCTLDQVAYERRLVDQRMVDVPPT